MTDESIDDGGTPARALSPPSDTVDYASTLHNVTRALLGHEQDGPRIGPYYVLHRIGAGGMGVVWAAYDPELDRRIAIKVLHRDDRDDGESVSRLVHEARALARLSHPNVVTVYGAGTYERGAYVAMEFVDGQTLAGWLKGEPKPWRSIVAMLLQAGRGLAAAHAAGIVHRDFKPDNVLVGVDGIGRVADFGLARPREIIDGPTPAERSSSSLTTAQTHQLIGTPAYVAPEQVVGDPPVPSADQFAFAVSCWEALVGAPPHAGKLIGELLDARRDGRIEAPPRGCPVPRRLLRVLERAMAPAPEDRFPDMGTLLAAMERSSGVGSRRWFAPALAMAATLSVGAYALGRAAPAAYDESEPCTGFEHHLDGVWDPARRDDVVAKLSGAQLSWAAGAATTIADGLDRHAQSWLEVRTDACRAHRAGEISDEMLDFRTSCLDRDLAGFAGTIDVLATPDARVIAQAHALVGQLHDPGDCNAVAAEVLLLARPSDPEERALGAALLNDVARLYPRMSVHFPITKEDTATVDGLLARAELSRDMKARAEVWKFAATRSGDAARSEALLRRAIADGVRARDDELVFQAAHQLVGYVFSQGRPDEALREADLAEAYNDRLRSWGGDAPKFLGLTARHAGELEDQRALIEGARGHTDAAMRHFSAAIAHLAPYAEKFPLSLMRVHNNVGEALRSSGRGFEAMVNYDAAIAVGRGELPANHPDIASIHNNRGAALVELGALEAGEVDLRFALAVAEVPGQAQPKAVGLAKLNLAILDADRGRLVDARREAHEAREVLIALLDPKHPYVQLCALPLAAVERREGAPERARALLEIAWPLLERRLGAGNSMLAEVLNERSRIARALGELDTAEADARRSVALLEKAEGVVAASLADAHAEIAEVMLARGRADDALSEVANGLAAFGDAALRHPLRAKLLTIAGEAHLRRGDRGAARTSLQTAAEIETGRDIGDELPNRTDAALARVGAPANR